MASQKYMQVPVNKIWVLEVFDKQLMCRGQARSGKSLQLDVEKNIQLPGLRILLDPTKRKYQAISKSLRSRPAIQMGSPPTQADLYDFFLKPNYYVNMIKIPDAR